MAKKHEDIADNLSKTEKALLMSAGSNKVGAKCVLVDGSSIHKQMFTKGLIGRNGGLTVTGSCVREVLDNRSYAELGL